jgi:hypothetical protein
LQKHSAVNNKARVLNYGERRTIIDGDSVVQFYFIKEGGRFVERRITTRLGYTKDERFDPPVKFSELPPCLPPACAAAGAEGRRRARRVGRLSNAANKDQSERAKRGWKTRVGAALGGATKRTPSLAT